MHTIIERVKAAKADLNCQWSNGIGLTSEQYRDVYDHLDKALQILESNEDRPRSHVRRCLRRWTQTNVRARDGTMLDGPALRREGSVTVRMVSAREIVGKKIVSFDPGTYILHGQTLHNPHIRLDDGSVLYFSAEEKWSADGDGYGIFIGRTKGAK